MSNLFDHCRAELSKAKPTIRISEGRRTIFGFRPARWNFRSGAERPKPARGRRASGNAASGGFDIFECETMRIRPTEIPSRETGREVWPHFSSARPVRDSQLPANSLRTRHSFRAETSSTRATQTFAQLPTAKFRQHPAPSKRPLKRIGRGFVQKGTGKLLFSAFEICTKRKKRILLCAMYCPKFHTILSITTPGRTLRSKGVSL